jgi:hypothetical protein
VVVWDAIERVLLLKLVMRMRWGGHEGGQVGWAGEGRMGLLLRLWWWLRLRLRLKRVVTAMVERGGRWVAREGARALRAKVNRRQLSS